LVKYKKKPKSRKRAPAVPPEMKERQSLSTTMQNMALATNNDTTHNYGLPKPAHTKEQIKANMKGKEGMPPVMVRKNEYRNKTFFINLIIFLLAPDYGFTPTTNNKP
jgi:hypothetical protein